MQSTSYGQEARSRRRDLHSLGLRVEHSMQFMSCTALKRRGRMPPASVIWPFGEHPRFRAVGSG
jgi:hypothetical protein